MRPIKAKKSADTKRAAKSKKSAKPKKSARSGWRMIQSQTVFANRYFQLRIDQCRLPDGRIMPRYFVCDFPDWVQVVAITRSGEFVLVDQYRYPGKGWYLEFPGGSTHPNRKEKPLTAAKRELREETGCVAHHWKYLGYHYPNPALLNNRCHVFLATGCQKIEAPNLDPFEELHAIRMTPAEFLREIKKSKKIHSLMLATFEMARPHVEKLLSRSQK